ncbi:hypothetical protein Y032_0167g132 [Ancylostoma ceylanicum]|uniref:Uncharacterized protein n=1 Tax=Ancylostoma ceylanicum TaxID=53326 RepID=A0A016SWJ6_9BILA|nr:hypothetical protein Y032_0167g132 [Ancylostoma ceylanicum]
MRKSGEITISGRKRSEKALRRLTTTIPACAARLRGFLVEAVDGSQPSNPCNCQLNLPRDWQFTIIIIVSCFWLARW